MSYVFSKALQQQNKPSEERQRRNTLPPKWTSPLARTTSDPASRVPPPVARKPKLSSSSQEEPTKSTSDRKEAFRKSSLPARSMSVDYDAGMNVPKMGGAFARLQANLEKPEPSGASSIYSEVYEAYRIKRSLKEHGVLPTELRNNEQLQKYVPEIKDAPPKVLPKPRRSSADYKRGIFGGGRSETMPAVINECPKPVARKSSLDDATKDSVFSERIEEKKENDPEVVTMKEVIAKEKSEIVEGQRRLSDTIDELDSIDFDIRHSIIEPVIEEDENEDRNVDESKQNEAENAFDETKNSENGDQKSEFAAVNTDIEEEAAKVEIDDSNVDSKSSGSFTVCDKDGSDLEIAPKSLQSNQENDGAAESKPGKSTGNDPADSEPIAEKMVDSEPIAEKMVDSGPIADKMVDSEPIADKMVDSEPNQIEIRTTNSEESIKAEGSSTEALESENAESVDSEVAVNPEATQETLQNGVKAPTADDTEIPIIESLHEARKPIGSGEINNNVEVFI